MARISGFQPGDEGSIPSRRTIHVNRKPIKVLDMHVVEETPTINGRIIFKMLMAFRTQHSKKKFINSVYNNNYAFNIGKRGYFVSGTYDTFDPKILLVEGTYADFSSVQQFHQKCSMFGLAQTREATRRSATDS
jgi:hypothetical protein